MDTKLLECFVAVTSTGTLSAAGSQLGITQSMVSRRLQELEAQCGAPLLYRHGRGVRLTPAGEVLKENAPAMLAQWADVIGRVATAGTAEHGRVSIGVSPSVMSAVGVVILDRVAAQYPEITLQAVTGYSRYVHEWLLQGRIDIGVLSDTGLSNQLLAEDLGAARVVLAGLRAFVPAGRTALDFRELDGIPLILPTSGQGLRRYVDEVALKAGVRLNIVREVDDIPLTRSLMAAGRGATLVSELAVRDDLSHERFAGCEVHQPTLRARSVMATALNRPVTPAMKAVMGVLRSVCAEVLMPPEKLADRS